MKVLALFTVALLLTTASVRADDGMSKDATTIKAGDYVLDPSHGKVTWSVSHLGFSTYMGQFSNVSAKLKIDPKAPERTELNAKVETTSVATLNEKLDDELKSDGWFNADKFPQATFEATKVSWPNEPAAHSKWTPSAAVEGNLTLLGVTKPETMTVTFNQTGVNPIDKKYRLGFSGHMTIKRSDFGMTKYVPMVGDDVTLDLEGEFVPAE